MNELFPELCVLAPRDNPTRRGLRAKPLDDGALRWSLLVDEPGRACRVGGWFELRAGVWLFEPSRSLVFRWSLVEMASLTAFLSALVELDAEIRSPDRVARLAQSFRG